MAHRCNNRKKNKNKKHCIIFYEILNIYVYVYIYEFMCTTKVPKEGTGSPRTGIPEDCKAPHNKGTQNQTQVLQEQ